MDRERRDERLHEWDDDGCCIHCSDFDHNPNLDSRCIERMAVALDRRDAELAEARARLAEVEAIARSAVGAFRALLTEMPWPTGHYAVRQNARDANYRLARAVAPKPPGNLLAAETEEEFARLHGGFPAGPLVASKPPGEATMSTDLDRLEALLDVATQGSWCADLSEYKDVRTGNGEQFIMGQCDDYYNPRQQDDARLVVAAINALPDLIAELRAARADLAEGVGVLETVRLQGDRNGYCPDCGRHPCAPDCDLARLLAKH